MTRSVDDLEAAAPAVSRDAFVEGMSRATNSVNVVTSLAHDGPCGITVSAATSVTAEPPTLLVCIHDDSPTARAILESRVLCVNVLAETQQYLSEIFAGRTEVEGGRFSTEGWDRLATGAPALMDALASFDCRLVSWPRVGTHHVFIATVVAVRCGEGSPLIYTRRGYRGLRS